MCNKPEENRHKRKERVCLCTNYNELKLRKVKVKFRKVVEFPKTDPMVYHYKYNLQDDEFTRRPDRGTRDWI